ncbi:tetratricopeptide repeat protein 29 [Vombatus ursinus]|uniref:tetratricopeptide repeat protein 29 n=1 Tax=Vombatus ursinus TaxID=29139 RepID=UPI000FFD4C3A|nr:tetratricopeptide repeat protein 29 [Vombatus ursinus]
MTTLPPVQIEYSKLALLTRKRKTCSPSGLTKAQLLKIKGETDKYLELKWKGLTKEEAAGPAVFSVLETGDTVRTWVTLSLLSVAGAAGVPQGALAFQATLEPRASPRAVHLPCFRLPLPASTIEAQMLEGGSTTMDWSNPARVERQSCRSGSGRHLEEAAERYETFHEMTEGRLWQDLSGHNLHSTACENLRRIYTMLAERMLNDKQYKHAIKTLLKACAKAKEGGDKKMEGEAAFALGLAYHAAGEFELAKSRRSGEGEETETPESPETNVRYRYSLISSTVCVMGLHITWMQAVTLCSGELRKGRVTRLGFYTKACECFKQAFDTTTEFTDIPLVDETKVHFGIAKAHQMMIAVNSYIESADFNSLTHLLTWKENRNNIFPEPIVEQSSDSRNKRLSSEQSSREPEADSRQESKECNS